MGFGNSETLGCISACSGARRLQNCLKSFDTEQSLFVRNLSHNSSRRSEDVTRVSANCYHPCISRKSSTHCASLIPFADLILSLDRATIGARTTMGPRRSVRQREQRRGGAEPTTGPWSKISFPTDAKHLPIADQDVLVGLTSLPDIHTWCKARADEYLKFAHILLSISSFVSPIHQLPTEILEQIFELSWHDRTSLNVKRV